MGCSRVQIVSQSLRSIGLLRTYSDEHTNLQQLIIKDAPYLERLLRFEGSAMEVTVSVVSAPKLHVLALPSVDDLTHDVGSTTFQIGSTAFQVSPPFSL